MILGVVNTTTLNQVYSSKIFCTRQNLSPLIPFRVPSYKNRFPPDLEAIETILTLRIKITIFQQVSIHIGYNWKSIQEFHSP